MAHDVFISYCSVDKASADAACAILESEGLRCWIAPRDIVPGSEWTESILDGINASQAMVVIFSQRANDSPQVRREVERAVHHGIPIVPVRIEDVMPTRAMEYLISTPHWMDAITPPMDSHFRQLAASLRMLMKNVSIPGPVVGRNRPSAGASKSVDAAPPRGNRNAVFAVAATVVVCAITAAYVAHLIYAKHDSTLQNSAVAPSVSRPVSSFTDSAFATVAAKSASQSMKPANPADVAAIPLLTAWVTEGNARLKNGDYAGAIAVFGHAIDADPHDAPALMGHGIASIKLDVNPGARRDELKQAIALDGKLADAYIWLSFDTDDPVQAVGYAKKAVDLNGDSCEAHAVLAMSYGADGDFLHGVPESQKAHQLDSTNSLGLLAAALGGDVNGLDLCRTAIQRDPNFAYCYLVEAIVSKNDMAVMARNNAVLTRLSPESASAYAVRSMYDGAIGHREDSYHDTVEALKLRPGSPLLLSYAAVAEQLTGRIDDAKKHIETAWGISPSDLNIIRLRESIEGH